MFVAFFPVFLGVAFNLVFCVASLQSLTGKYREIQGNPCNENRDPAMKTGVPCNEYRFFPVGIDLQGFPVSFTGFGFAVYQPFLRALYRGRLLSFLLSCNVLI